MKAGVVGHPPATRVASVTGKNRAGSDTLTGLGGLRADEELVGACYDGLSTDWTAVCARE